MREQTITAIIPTYKPDARLLELVKRLLVQTRRPDRILLVNTVSDTGEKYLDQAAAEDERVQVIHIPKSEFDHGGTRNMAARRSDTDLLLFMTMDAVPADRHLVEELAGAFEDPQTACAYARQLPAQDAGLIERYTRSFNYPDESRRKGKADLEELGIRTFFCSNVCAMYRRDVYEQLGGFPKKTIFNEDMIYAGHAVMAGWFIAYKAQARVIHSHNYSGVTQFHRNFDLGVSQADHPEVFGLAASEGTGIQLVKDTARYLLRRGRPDLLVRLVWQSGCKFLGYRLGKAYQKLPQKVILRCTMNPSYWKDNGDAPA